MATGTTTKDVNTIPYDAPLSFVEPTYKWCRDQANKGRLGLTIPPDQVPGADLTGKWVIVTGANNGIGREATLQFAQWGASVILGCRNPPPHENHPNSVVKECKAKARAAGHEKSVFEWWEIDMTKLHTVEAFAKRWIDAGRPLDILCNNAGIGSSPGGDKVFKTADGFEIVHQTNFISHVLLTLTVLPSIAAAPAPRIVCTTSCMQFFGKFNVNNFNGEVPNTTGAEGLQYYNNNKLFYQAWLTELQHKLLQHEQYKHITVNGIHPGYVNTGVWVLNKSRPLVEWVLQRLADVAAITPFQGSLAITHAATSPEKGPNPTIQGVGAPNGRGGARYFSRIWEEPPMPHAKDPDCRCRVWRKVNDELKLEEKGLLDVLGLKCDGL